MTARAWRALGAVLLLGASVPACGKKGNPLPPLRTVPASIADLTASRSGDRIELQFTVPAGDEGTIVTPDRIEIYRAAAAPDATAPLAAPVVTEPRNLRTQIAVRPADAPVPAPGAMAPPAPGDRASYGELIDPATSDASLTYVAVGVVGRNRRGPAALVTIPLVNLPSPPESLIASHNETSITLSWTGAGPLYRVFRVAPAPEVSVAELLTPKPIEVAQFDQPVEFGRERCFVVRTVQTTGAVTIEGSASAPQCLTPEDRYPPAPPTNLQAIQEGSAITLNWTPVDATDLAGYVVLRGDVEGISMQPLVREPIRQSTFRDAAVTAGMTYTYSVYAVDNAPAANVSQQSGRQIVTVR